MDKSFIAGVLVPWSGIANWLRVVVATVFLLAGTQAAVCATDLPDAADGSMPVAGISAEKILSTLRGFQDYYDAISGVVTVVDAYAENPDEVGLALVKRRVAAYQARGNGVMIKIGRLLKTVSKNRINELVEKEGYVVRMVCLYGFNYRGVEFGDVPVLLLAPIEKTQTLNGVKVYSVGSNEISYPAELGLLQEVSGEDVVLLPAEDCYSSLLFKFNNVVNAKGWAESKGQLIANNATEGGLNLTPEAGVLIRYNLLVHGLQHRFDRKQQLSPVESEARATYLAPMWKGASPKHILLDLIFSATFAGSGQYSESAKMVLPWFLKQAANDPGILEKLRGFDGSAVPADSTEDAFKQGLAEGQMEQMALLFRLSDEELSALAKKVITAQYPAMLALNWPDVKDLVAAHFFEEEPQAGATLSMADNKIQAEMDPTCLREPREAFPDRERQ